MSAAEIVVLAGAVALSAALVVPVLSWPAWSRRCRLDYSGSSSAV